MKVNSRKVTTMVMDSFKGKMGRNTQGSSIVVTNRGRDVVFMGTGKNSKDCSRMISQWRGSISSLMEHI